MDKIGATKGPYYLSPVRPTAGSLSIKFGQLTITRANADNYLILNITAPKGLHTFPAVRLAQAVQGFKAEIRLHNQTGEFAPVREIMEALCLMIEKGQRAVFSFEGEDSDAAREAIRQEIEILFNESGDLGPLLTFDDFAKHELAGPAEQGAGLVPGDRRQEELPAGFLRGDSGNLSRVAVANVLVINNGRLIEQNNDTPAAADEVQKFSAAVGFVSAQIERKAELSSDQDVNVRNLRLLQEFSGEVMRIIQEQGIGTGRAAQRFFQKYQRSKGAFLEDMRAILEDVVLARYGMLSEVLGQIDLARQGQVVLVVSTLTPLTALRIVDFRDRVKGVVVEKRLNRESHQVIILDDAGIPVLTGLPDIVGKVKNGDRVLLDSGEGVLVTEPASESAAVYAERRLYEQRVMAQRIDSVKPELVVTTADGAGIRVMANAERVEELAGEAFPGVGLFRSEFTLIKNPDGSRRDSEPHFHELVEMYARLLSACGGRPLIFRTYDFEPTKYPRYFRQDLIYRGLEAGPELYLLYDAGSRAMKFEGLNYLFRKQVRAFLLATGIVARQRDGDIRPSLMFPMISGAEKFDLARRIFAEEQARLTEQKEPFFPAVKVGTMVETLGAIMDADALAARADFLSIGTNDLKAATFVELGERDAKEAVQIIDGVPPKLLAYIEAAAAAGKRYGKPVSCCGVLAGNLRYVPLLIGSGVDTLSVNRGQLKALSFFLRQVTLGESRGIVEEALGLGTAAEVDRILTRDLKRFTVPDAGGHAPWQGLDPIRSMILGDRSISEIIEQGKLLT